MDVGLKFDKSSRHAFYFREMICRMHLTNNFFSEMCTLRKFSAQVMERGCNQQKESY